MLDSAKLNKNMSGRILLVEDSEVNQLVFKGMLDGLGFEVDIAINGEQGVEMWKQAAYDVIFMDVQMPVMSGLDATQLIRSTEKPEDHQMIVAVTANAYAEDEKACRDAGMDAFVTKPIDINALKATLFDCLQST